MRWRSYRGKWIFEEKYRFLNSYLNFRTVAVPALISKRKFACTAVNYCVSLLQEYFLASFSCRYELTGKRCIIWQFILSFYWTGVLGEIM